MITAIELAMIARLKAVGEALGINWGTVTSYPDDWDQFLAANENVRFPAAWVVFSGWNATEEVGDDWLTVRDASFAVVVAYENLRPDAQAQRHGGPDPALEPGSYRLIEAALTSLAGQSLGILNKPLKAGPGRHVARTEQDVKRGLSRYSMLFTCDFSLQLVDDGEDDPATIAAMHANWDVPLFDSPAPIDADPAAPGRQLPDDRHADATDHIIFGDD